MLEESKFTPIKAYNNIGYQPSVLFNDTETTFTPSELLSARYTHTKLINEMIKTPFNEYYPHGLKVNITSSKHQNMGRQYQSILQFVNQETVVLPPDFDFNSKHAAYIDAIGSIYYNNEIPYDKSCYIKAQHLINFMSGKKTRSSVREEEIEQLIDDLQVMREISINIYSEDHQAYNALNKRKNDKIKRIYSGALINSEYLMGYIKINAMPILYLYAQDAEQVSTYPKHILDMTTIELTGENGEEIILKSPIKRMTPRIIIIRDYFLREVIPMLERKKKTYKKTTKPYESRLFTTIYDYLQNEDPLLDLSKRKGDIDKNIENVLMYLKEQQVINRYVISSKGKTKNHKITIY